MKWELDIKNSDIENAISEYVSSERDRSLLRRRLIDGIRFEQLAEEYDLSVTQTKNIVYKYEQFLYEKVRA